MTPPRTNRANASITFVIFQNILPPFGCKDNNKLVAGAAASSPQFTERDAIRVAANRNVHEEVLRIISKNRVFTRGYQIKLALVGNPKTPLPFASGFIPYLRESDLKALTKDKNIPSNIKTLVRQQLAKKVKKR